MLSRRKRCGRQSSVPEVGCFFVHHTTGALQEVQSRNVEESSLCQVVIVLGFPDL